MPVNTAPSHRCPAHGTTAACPRFSLAAQSFSIPSSAPASSRQSALFLSPRPNSPVSDFQIRPAAVSPFGEHCVCGLLLAPPATSVHPIGKSYPGAPPALIAKARPRSQPPWFPSHPLALRIHSSHTHLCPATAALSDPISHSQSMAAIPAAHTQPAPCTRAIWPTGTKAATPPESPLVQPRLLAHWCSRPP